MMSRKFPVQRCRMPCTERAVVVVFADDVRVDLARGRVERVDGRVDAQRGDVTRQHDGGVQGRPKVVGDGSVRSSGGNVDGLDRGDRPTLVDGDPLLQMAHSSASVGW